MPVLDVTGYQSRPSTYAQECKPLESSESRYACVFNNRNMPSYLEADVSKLHSGEYLRNHLHSKCDSSTGHDAQQMRYEPPI